MLITLDTPDIAAKNDQVKAAVEVAKAKKLKIDSGARVETIKIKKEILLQAESSLDFAKKISNASKNCTSKTAFRQNNLKKLKICITLH